MEYLEKILEESFLNYSAFVLQRRAIPDARDGLKYTGRQILHAQFKDKLDAKHPFKKSQKSVAAATSFSYVHGDSSAYEQIVRMGRPLVQRYFLEEFNGNQGTIINSDDYSAPRYTESRLSALGLELFNFINKGGLTEDSWSPTYDEEGVFPLVLPSVGFYNICNGSFGSIGVGLISSIPQFNLREVNQTICNLIGDPNTDVDLLPDFASGGILLNPKTTAASLAKGEGKSALIRGVVKQNKKEGFLEITELPYGVYTNTICIELQKAADKGKPPFDSFKDLTKTSVHIRIYSKHLDELEEWLYKNTSVQKHYTIKLIMLDKGKLPRLFTLKEALLEHIDHAKGVLRRAYEFDLNKLKTREEIIRGLIRAHSIIDQIIGVIKNESSGRADAIKNLIARFEFSEIQATAIVDMKLHMLTKIDIGRLEEELKFNLDEQAELQGILADESLFNARLMVYYKTISDAYGDKRRTKVFDGDNFESDQDGATVDVPFMMVGDGEKFLATTRPQDQALPDGFEYSCAVSPDDEVVIITDQFRGFKRNATQIPMGENLWSSTLKLNKGEKVVCVQPLAAFETAQYVIVKLDSGDTYSVHQSYILTGASQRGKKLVSKKVQVQSVELSESNEGLPQLR